MKEWDMDIIRISKKYNNKNKEHIYFEEIMKGRR